MRCGISLASFAPDTFKFETLISILRPLRCAAGADVRGQKKKVRRNKWTIDRGNLVSKMKGGGHVYWGENETVLDHERVRG